MNTFVKAVVSGFAFTLGATLFRKVAKKIGLDDEPAKTTNSASAANSPAGESTSAKPATVKPTYFEADEGLS
jgi:hypothetical protein